MQEKKNINIWDQLFCYFYQSILNNFNIFGDLSLVL